MGQQVNMKEQG